MKTFISEQEILEFLSKIETGEITLSSKEDTQNFYSGDLQYFASNAWGIKVFIDAGEWDYIDSIQLDENSVLEFDELDKMERVRNYSPSEKSISSKYGLKRSR